MERWFEHLNAADYELPAELVERTPSPALVVFLPLVRENLRRMIEYAGTPRRWRPHLKTTKSPEVWAELLRVGVREFKCATTREARLLCELCVEQGLDEADVLVAYPLIGPSLAALGELARRFPTVRLSVLCEDAEQVEHIPAELSIFVDVNPGMHRTGIPLEHTDRILAVARDAGARFRGVHYYDGHLHEGTPAERRREAFACYDGLIELTRSLTDAGVRVGEMITSGTPTFLHALAYPAFESQDTPTHRISPGTVVFHDQRSEQENPDLDLVPAACLLTRVISHPAADIATTDGGSKSIASDAGDPCAFALERPDLLALSPSEEHLPLRAVEGPLPERGATLLLVPRHVCPTVNLAEEMLLVDDEETRIVPVRGRAHDLSGP